MITMYATADKGEGRVMQIGEYESIEEIVILPSMFAPNTEISFQEGVKESNDELPNMTKKEYDYYMSLPDKKESNLTQE